jgi:hypothetical protein
VQAPAEEDEPSVDSVPTEQLKQLLDLTMFENFPLSQSIQALDKALE